MELLNVSQLIRQFSNHRDVAEQIQKLAEKLNRHIEAFNNASDLMEKRQILYKILQVQQSADEWIAPKHIIEKPLFKEIFYKSLYLDIQNEFETLGVFSLDRDSLEKSLKNDKRINRVISSFPQLISRLSGDKIDALANELAKPNASSLKDRLESLFSGWQEPYARQFFETYTIEVLGGSANSKNIRVTNIVDPSESLVLKLENKLGFRKSSACARIRRSPNGKNLLIRRDVARHAFYRASGKNVTNTLCVEEYCPQGSLLMGAQRMHETENILNIQQFAAHIYSRMAQKIMLLEKASVFFPDMKSSNWFLVPASAPDTELDLKIGDTKTLVSAMLGNQYNLEQLPAVSTPVYDPPEFESGSDFSIDKAHSFILGLNLYQSLTNNNILPKFIDEDRVYTSRFSNNSESVDEYFSHAIFQNEEGRELQNLILDTLQKNPDQRPSVEKILERLNQINNKLTYKVTEPLRIEAIQEITHYATHLGLLGEPPERFKGSIQYYNELIRSKKSPSEIEAIKNQGILYIEGTYKKELNKILNKIKQQYQLGRTDKKMDEFYNEFKKKIYSAPPNIELKHELNLLLETFKNNPRLNEIARNFHEFKEDIQNRLVAEAQFGSIEDRASNQMFEDFNLFESFDFNQYKDKYQSIQKSAGQDEEESPKNQPK